MRRLWCAWFVLLLMVVAVVCPVGPAAAGVTHYVALGDSLAFGVGATGFYGYVYRFRDYLATRWRVVALQNRAIPGIRSEHLLFQLRYDTTTRAAVKHADVLTISIGGNNLIRCASN